MTQFFVDERSVSQGGTWAVADWQRVWDETRVRAQGFGTFQNLFIYRNAGGFTHAQTDGAYSWVEPLVNNPDPNYGYLTGFYNTAPSPTSNVQVWGSSYKGFDDRKSGFTGAARNRYMNQGCGTVWLNTFTRANSDYIASKGRLPFMQVVTWNDYDEGTEIESGIDNCISKDLQQFAISMQGSTLSWTYQFTADQGTMQTVNNYELYFNNDGGSAKTLKGIISPACSQNIRQVSCSYDVSQLTGWDRSRTNYLYVKAIGKPSITNFLFDKSAAWAPGGGTTGYVDFTDPLDYMTNVVIAGRWYSYTTWGVPLTGTQMASYFASTITSSDPNVSATAQGSRITFQPKRTGDTNCYELASFLASYGYPEPYPTGAATSSGPTSGCAGGGTPTNASLKVGGGPPQCTQTNQYCDSEWFDVMVDGAHFYYAVASGSNRQNFTTPQNLALQIRDVLNGDASSPVVASIDPSDAAKVNLVPKNAALCHTMNWNVSEYEWSGRPTYYLVSSGPRFGTCPN